MDFTGFLIVIFFCASGGAVVDQTCDDGSKPTHLEMRVVTANGCNLNEDPKCDRFENVFEVARDGIVIASVPAEVLTKRELDLVLQAIIPSARAP